MQEQHTLLDDLVANAITVMDGMYAHYLFRGDIHPNASMHSLMQYRMIELKVPRQVGKSAKIAQLAKEDPFSIVFEAFPSSARLANKIDNLVFGLPPNNVREPTIVVRDIKRRFHSNPISKILIDEMDVRHYDYLRKVLEHLFMANLIAPETFILSLTTPRF